MCRLLIYCVNRKTCNPFLLFYTPFFHRRHASTLSTILVSCPYLARLHFITQHHECLLCAACGPCLRRRLCRRHERHRLSGWLQWQRAPACGTDRPAFVGEGSPLGRALMPTARARGKSPLQAYPVLSFMSFLFPSYFMLNCCCFLSSRPGASAGGARQGAGLLQRKFRDRCAPFSSLGGALRACWGPSHQDGRTHIDARALPACRRRRMATALCAPRCNCSRPQRRHGRPGAPVLRRSA